MLSSPNRLVTTTPSDGSRTITVEETADVGHAGPSMQNGILRLQGGPRSQPRVAWDEGVIDNENCGRKKSKICCIYRKPKAFDESSDESSSDDDSDSGDDGRARPPHHHHHHRHEHGDHFPDGDDGDGNTSTEDGGSTTIHELDEGHECNAYESQPRKGKGRSND